MITVDKTYQKDSLICGRLTVEEDGTIVIADDVVNKYFGTQNVHTFDKMIYQNDRKQFYSMMEKEEYTDPVFVRLKQENDTYRWVVLFVVNRNFLIGEIKYTEIEIRDLIALNNRFSYYDRSMYKYKHFLSLSNDRFLEYEHDTDIIKIYTFKQNKSEMLEMDTLEEWKKRALRLRYVEDSSIAMFEQLCSNLKNGVDGFTLQFETSMMKKGGSKETLNIRSQIIFRNHVRLLTVGVISVVNAKTINKDYFFSTTESNKDSATGLMNKKAMTEFSINRVGAYNSKKAQGNLFFIILDIDYFKTVNDTYGHMFGDEVILRFSKMLEHMIGNKGVVGRIGGDEFFVLFETMEDDKEVRALLTDIRKRMAFEFPNKVPPYKFTCSAGVSQYRRDAKDYETLFRIADKALYIAKGKGRDRYIVYQPEKHGKLEDDIFSSVISNNGLLRRQIDNADMIANLASLLVKSKYKAVQSVLNELAENMLLSGISIYMGEELNCVCSAGFYPKPISNANYINAETYLPLFNEFGINVVNDVEQLVVNNAAARKILAKSDICSTLQMLIGEKRNIKGMVSFDVCGITKRKWSEADIAQIYIIFRILADVLLEEYKDK